MVRLQRAVGTRLTCLTCWGSSAGFTRLLLAFRMAPGIWREATPSIDHMASSCVYTHTIARTLICLCACLASKTGSLPTRGSLRFQGGRVGSVFQESCPLQGSSALLAQLAVHLTNAPLCSNPSHRRLSSSRWYTLISASVDSFFPATSP